MLQLRAHGLDPEFGWITLAGPIKAPVAAISSHTSGIFLPDAFALGFWSAAAALLLLPLLFVLLAPVLLPLLRICLIHPQAPKDPHKLVRPSDDDAVYRMFRVEPNESESEGGDIAPRWREPVSCQVPTRYQAAFHILAGTTVQTHLSCDELEHPRIVLGRGVGDWERF